MFVQKLRRIEVALIEYREALEEQGNKNSEEIERKVEIHRKKLEVDYGLSGSNEGSRNQKSIVERKEKPEDSREPSKKRHRGKTHSQSPPRKSSTRERDHDLDRGRLRDRDRLHDLNRDRREKSSSHDRGDHGRSRERDRDWRRRDLR
ncbi:hypothetical protein HID58_023419 [Brassica napus]|uniref:CWF21 domain-containing protein n=1 Tax=Brassica napus TaxID=3708 RepID=A0ABQ8D219_BRANA|nr:hypothetical protein HID58_023419 [Brassica napus]